jgi:hypothetical protein
MRALWLRSLLSALAASAALAGCGSGAVSTTNSTHTHAVVPSSTGGSERQPAGQSQSAATSLTPEEKQEYDSNEGRCHDDGGSVRDVGTVGAYCAFPARSNDFHLLESATTAELSNEEE